MGIPWVFHLIAPSMASDSGSHLLWTTRSSLSSLASDVVDSWSWTVHLFICSSSICTEILMIGSILLSIKPLVSL